MASLARRLVAVAALADAQQVALLEGQVLDEAVFSEIVDPLVDDDLEHFFAGVGAAQLAARVASAGARDSASDRAVLDALRGVVRVTADRAHVVARVARCDDSAVAAQAVGSGAR